MIPVAFFPRSYQITGTPQSARNPLRLEPRSSSYILTHRDQRNRECLLDARTQTNVISITGAFCESLTIHSACRGGKNTGYRLYEKACCCCRWTFDRSYASLMHTFTTDVAVGCHWDDRPRTGNRELTFPSHVQNVPVSSRVFCSTTRSIPATDSSALMIPSTSHPRDMFAMFLSQVSHSFHTERVEISHVVTSPGCTASIVVVYRFRSSSAAIC